MEANPMQNTFLRILLQTKNNRITADVHYKATKTFQYSCFTLCRPIHTRKTLHIDLPRRICSIVEEKYTTDKLLPRYYKKYFIISCCYSITETNHNTNYKDTLIDNGIQDAQIISKTRTTKR